MAENKRTFESEAPVAQELKIHPRVQKDERPEAEFGERALSRVENAETARHGSVLSREVVLRLIGWITKS